MTNEEKAQELGSIHARQYHHNTYPEYSHNSELVFSNKEIEAACNEMAEWKDKKIKEILLAYTKWLDKRGFFKEDLQCDFPHQIETFLEMKGGDK